MGSSLSDDGKNLMMMGSTLMVMSASEDICHVF